MKHLEEAQLNTWQNGVLMAAGVCSSQLFAVTQNHFILSATVTIQIHAARFGTQLMQDTCISFVCNCHEQ